MGAKKFALRRCVIAKARNSSPCALTTPHIWRLCVRWASVSRKSRWRGCAGRVFSRDRVVIAGAGLILSRRGTVLLHCCPASIVCGNRSQAPQAPRRPPIERGLVRVCLLWPCRRSPHRRRLWFWCECPGPAVASGRGLPGTVVQLSSFACNSPRASCLFVLVRAAESLLFGNCMRLWRGRVMGHMARGVARGMWRWGEVRGCADDRVKGLPCGT